MTALYIANIENLSIEESLPRLSPFRAEKVLRLRDKMQQRRSIGAALLLDRAFAAYMPSVPRPVTYSVSENGKPYLEGGGLFFSLSHSGGCSLCAVSDAEIGADIEKIRAFSPTAAAKFFTDAEYGSLLLCDDPDEEFSRLWAKKESLVKARGETLFALGSLTEEGFCFYEAAHGCYRIALCKKGSEFGELTVYAEENL